MSEHHHSPPLPEIRRSAAEPVAPDDWPPTFTSALLHVLEAGRAAVGAMPPAAEDDEGGDEHADDGTDEDEAGDVTVIAAVVAVCRGATQDAALRTAAEYAKTARTQGLEIRATGLAPEGTGEWDLILVLTTPETQTADNRSGPE